LHLLAIVIYDENNLISNKNLEEAVAVKKAALLQIISIGIFVKRRFNNG